MTGEAAPIWDREALRRQVVEAGGDEAFVVELTTIFTADLEASLAALDAAVRSGDAALFRRIVHRIKGGAAAVCAASLRRAAESLERARDLAEIERSTEQLTALAARTIAALRPEREPPA